MVDMTVIRPLIYLNKGQGLSKVTIESLRSRIWEIDWYQNEWPWPSFIGRIKVMSTIALDSTLNISETVKDRGMVQKDHQ